ncbi:MAG: hypothetical protein ABR961_01970 [Thermoanaerobaculaceae bacterium]|jgi:hypothetical protein
MDDQTNEQKEETAPEATKKRTQGRSPSYPGIDLERALNLAGVIWEKERSHDAPIEAVWDDWGMKHRTGPALVAIAALKKFGLLDGAGGKVRLSTLALDILRDEREESPEKAERIREAAFKPPVHVELWEKYKGKLPTDANVKWYLTRERGFTDRGAEELIQQFRRTISFAGVKETDLQSEQQGDKLNGEEGKRVNARTADILPPGGPVREVPIPIPGNAWPILKAAFPLTKDAWGQMLAVLKAMEAGLTRPDPEPAPDAPPDLTQKDS